MSKTGMTIRPANSSDQKTWDKLVFHPLQTWAWGEFRLSMGIKVVRLMMLRGGVPIDGWQITFHRIPHTPFTVGYFPKGPMPTAEMLRSLTEYGRLYNAVYIQLEPNVRADDKTRIPEDGKTGEQEDDKNNFLNILLSKHLPVLIPSHHSLFSRYTFVLDLTKTEDDLLKAMHPKTRYNIKIAQKHGVIIREDNSPAAFGKYLELSDDTTRRQGFFAHNDKYQRNMWQTLHKAGIARLYTAKFDREILSAWIVFVFKDKIYYPYGASSRSHREVMAPNLLLWEIVRWAKAEGYKYFDLWGAIGPNPDTSDKWYGFHRFKQGYNPELIEYTGSSDLVLNPWLYRIYKTSDRLRWAFLNIIRSH